VMIRTQWANQTSSYRVSMTPTPDGGEEVPMILNGQGVTVSLPSTGTTVQRRFLVDSKEPVTVSATVRTGSVIMYVSLVPA
jgi:hypothetical protein